MQVGYCGRGTHITQNMKYLNILFLDILTEFKTNELLFT